MFPNEPIVATYVFGSRIRSAADIWHDSALLVSARRFVYFYHSKISMKYQFDEDERFIKTLDDLMAAWIDYGAKARGRYLVSGEIVCRVIWLMTTERLLCLCLNNEGFGHDRAVPLKQGEQLVGSIGDIFGHGLLISTSEKAIYARCETVLSHGSISELETFAQGDKASVSLAPRKGIFSSLRSPYELIITKEENGKSRKIKIGIGQEEMGFAKEVQTILNEYLSLPQPKPPP